MENENRIIGTLTDDKKCKVEFHGKGNILYIEDDANIADVVIHFYGDNSLVFLSKNKHKTKLRLDIYNNSVFYMGKDANTTRPIHAILSEGKHVFIGNDCLFSRDVWFRNGDPHLIYDIKTKQRTNVSKSIYLGDHVWIAQNVMISKGTRIGSGCIVGSWSMTGGKRMASNTVYGGSPCEKVKRGIFWRKPSSHMYTGIETKENAVFKSGAFVYRYSKYTMSFDRLEEKFTGLKEAESKLDYILENIQSNPQKNRFYIGSNRLLDKILRKLKDFIWAF